MGSSYGGALAIATALKYQRNLRSLIVTGGLASVPLTVREMRRLVNRLPPKIRATIAKYEALEDYQNPKYLAAVDAFYRRHVCRLPVWPREVTYSFEHLSGPVYFTMNGPNEFTIIGTIKDWDVTDRLPTIHIPWSRWVGTTKSHPGSPRAFIGESRDPSSCVSRRAPTWRCGRSGPITSKSFGISWTASAPPEGEQDVHSAVARGETSASADRDPRRPGVRPFPVDRGDRPDCECADHAERD